MQVLFLGVLLFVTKRVVLRKNHESEPIAVLHSARACWNGHGPNMQSLLMFSLCLPGLCRKQKQELKKPETAEAETEAVADAETS